MSGLYRQISVFEIMPVVGDLRPLIPSFERHGTRKEMLFFENEPDKLFKTNDITLKKSKNEPENGLQKAAVCTVNH